MTTVLLIVATAAALACPAHMLWRLRRGAGGSCLPLPRTGPDELWRRKAELEARIQAAEQAPQREPPSA